MAFGLRIKISPDENNTQPDRIAFQTAFWMDFGRNEHFDRRVKAFLFSFISSGDVTIEAYSQNKQNTDTLMKEIAFEREWALVRRDQFQMAWHRLNITENGTSELDWLTQEERKLLREFRLHPKDSMLNLSATINAQFGVTDKGVIACEFPSSIQICTAADPSINSFDAPWNFVLEALTFDENKRLHKRKVLYKLLVLWRKQDARQLDDCIIYDPSGRQIPGIDGRHKQWSMKNCLKGTEMVLFYSRVDTLPNEPIDPDCKDILLDPALAAAWQQEVHRMKNLAHGSPTAANHNQPPAGTQAQASSGGGDAALGGRGGAQNRGRGGGPNQARDASNKGRGASNKRPSAAPRGGSGAPNRGGHGAPRGRGRGQTNTFGGNGHEQISGSGPNPRQNQTGRNQNVPRILQGGANQTSTRPRGGGSPGLNYGERPDSR